MPTKLITAALEHPVTLAEARQHLRATTTEEDALILALVYAAVEHAETFTGRALVTQTWDLLLDGFPFAREIELPFPPLQSVTSVKYIDPDDAEQTLAAANYHVDAASTPGRVRLKPTASWPSIADQPNAVTVRFVAGFGGTAAVPFTIKAAILLVVGHLFEHREENQDFAVHAMPLGAERLLWPHRLVRL
jgi:uncharacterized phiE125 gp8 family phage protein